MSKLVLSQLDSLDWECRDADTRYLTHNYHPYSSKYIPQIPRYLIQHLSAANDTVLDPFVGSGTTLVECKLLGRHGIGVDLNPLACLISKVKATPIQPSILKSEVSELLMRIHERILTARGTLTLQPFGHQKYDEVRTSQTFASAIERWYQPQAISELKIIKHEVSKLTNQDVREFSLVAFSSILRTVSNAASGFGNLMISKMPTEKNHIFEKFSSRIELMTSEMEEFFRLANAKVNTKVVQGDCRSLTGLLEPESVDMICTHPPYMAAVPYAEYQKLYLWWLGFNPRELDAQLIGGERSREDTPERFERDMKKCFAEMQAVLKPNKYCCVVIGNPLYRKKIWTLNELFTKQAREVGFEFVKQITRGKYKMTMGKPSMRNEYILIFRRN